MRELPSGTVTFLFTDIEGSTRMLREQGREAYVGALSVHRRLLRDAFTRRGGVEVEMQGDSFHFAFPFARDAVAAAVEGQRALAEHAWESEPIRVRIGLHTGEPVQADGLYAGLDVHHAARVMSAGHGGQVILSSRTAELVDGELPPGLSLRDLGEHRLKDLATPQRLYQVGDGDFPPLATVASTNVPRPASSFVGREAEVAAVVERLERARLVTLTGPGGSGKTRLAIEAATAVLPAFADGVFWVGLAPLREPALVAETIAHAVGAKGDLARHIGHRKLLLLLDNFEHVMDAAPELAALLGACPNLTVLVTSRELLRLAGELEYRVPPLAETDAITLFSERAQLEPTEEIRELCRRLDSLPLAIELAAARTSALSAGQVLDRLSQRLDLLRGGRDAEPRQQTLRATIDWSYRLLADKEQRVFARLSVFPGGCTLDAAEQVTGADIDTLQSLVEKSLVRFSGDRYWLLETIREYAAECLDSSGEAHETAVRRSLFLVELVGPSGVDFTPMPQGWAERLEPESDNVRLSVAWALAAGRVEDAYRLATGYGDLRSMRGPLSDGRTLLDAVLRSEAVVAPDLRQKALRSASRIAARQRDFDAAEVLAEERLRLARTIGDRELIANTLVTRGITACFTDLARADALFHEALALVGAARNQRVVRIALGMLGWVAIARGDFAQASELCLRALRLAREVGDARTISLAGSNLGHVLAHEGRLGEALALQREALLVSRELDDMMYVLNTLVEVGAVAVARGDYEPAALLAGAAAVLADETENKLDPVLAKVFADVLDALRANMDADPFARSTQRGGELSLDEVTAYAVEFIDSTA